MCHRITPLRLDDLQAALAELERSGHARVPHADEAQAVPDAYPGSQLPLFTLDVDGKLSAVELTWGFPNVVPDKKNLVFNTRLETALSQLEAGRGMWADPITHGRCMIPVRAFCESWTQRGVDANGPQPHRTVRFRMEGHGIFLLACVRDEEHFSIVTTRPNAMVGRVHSRMPLVLGPGESRTWLGPGFNRLADRSGIDLTAQVLT